MDNQQYLFIKILTALSSILISASNSELPILQRFSNFSANGEGSMILEVCGIGGFLEAS
ncbi:GSCOCG00000574001-RA-CDS [Cotesia congregata]|nr:GSCOCG00000574001-RA-CDS [Cotesia congregata]